MISVYFLPLPHLVQCFFSSARRMLLSFQPMGDMLEFCLEITKQEDCVFISVLGLKKPRLIPYSNKNSLFDILQNASFLHTSENSLTVLLSYVNSETPSEKQRYHFLFVTHHLACLYCSLCRIGTFPHYGFIQCLRYSGALVKLKTSRHYWTANISSTPSTKKPKLLGESNLLKLQNQVLEFSSRQNSSCYQDVRLQP